MAVTQSEEALAQKVVDLSKKTAHVDTGALKRSIHYTVARGQIVFRQLFYGQYYDNSQLIENAQRIMKGVPYIIEELDEEGNVQKAQYKAASGRSFTTPEPRAGKNASRGAKALIEKLLAQRRKYAAKDNDKEDNRE